VPLVFAFLAFDVRTSAAKPQRLLLKGKSPARKAFDETVESGDTGGKHFLRARRFLENRKRPSVQPPARRPNISDGALIHILHKMASTAGSIRQTKRSGRRKRV